jgi:hypothetical protein
MPDRLVISDALHDVLVESGRLPAPQRRFDLGEIEPGWLVCDNDGERVGRVESQVDGYLVIRRCFGGVYLWLRLYIPPTAIRETHEGIVSLNIPRRWVGSMGWARRPRAAPTPPHTH